ncbi:flagellin lysine-N-methylase [Eubacterium sp. MSJ-13]|uniref:flagellin lysine-N-methylase n=1 Tax=Eubacterium sp. MSJ-13 TaxID=2841513 RepID=UPI0020A0D816|nr:flagellin lysine-N-methylase [Eubacterium sp. MSJ-13]MBU5478764.1 flagellin lysine-N-methylase [Eubacterium sp. MSJ-13]
MKVYIFGAYKDFRCMAGKCQATCCSGWKIVVDKEAYERFIELEDESLRADILSNIVEKDDVYSFKNMANGDCAMLDKDGLCRIQRNSDEKTLCNTCRKYPRLSFKDSDTMLLSMAASCPVVINYLCIQRYDDIWYQMTDDKKMYPVMLDDITGLSDEIYKFEQLFIKIQDKCFEKGDRLCELFYDFADIAVDMIIKCNDCVYLDGSFDIYEEQMDGHFFEEKYDRFIKLYGKNLFRFEKNYILYRILTAKYERSEQNTSERSYQIAGEIIMNRVIMLSLTQNEDFMDSIVQSVHWVYKAAVHGKISSSIMHKKVAEILSQ